MPDTRDGETSRKCYISCKRQPEKSNQYWQWLRKPNSVECLLSYWLIVFLIFMDGKYVPQSLVHYLYFFLQLYTIIESVMFSFPTKTFWLGVQKKVIHKGILYSPINKPNIFGFNIVYSKNVLWKIQMDNMKPNEKKNCNRTGSQNGSLGSADSPII